MEPPGGRARFIYGCVCRSRMLALRHLLAQVAQVVRHFNVEVRKTGLIMTNRHRNAHPRPGVNQLANGDVMAVELIQQAEKLAGLIHAEARKLVAVLLRDARPVAHRAKRQDVWRRIRCAVVGVQRHDMTIPAMAQNTTAIGRERHEVLNGHPIHEIADVLDDDDIAIKGRADVVEGFGKAEADDDGRHLNFPLLETLQQMHHGIAGERTVFGNDQRLTMRRGDDTVYLLRNGVIAGSGADADDFAGGINDTIDFQGNTPATCGNLRTSTNDHAVFDSGLLGHGVRQYLVGQLAGGYTAHIHTIIAKSLADTLVDATTRLVQKRPERRIIGLGRL